MLVRLGFTPCIPDTATIPPMRPDANVKTLPTLICLAPTLLPMVAFWAAEFLL